MGSDNLRGVPQAEEPGNQQERLVTIGWVIGFVDGEGCFSIGFTRQPDRSKRKDFEKFAKCLELIVESRHLTREGLAEIAEIAQTMNRESLETRDDQNPQRPYVGRS